MRRRLFCGSLVLVMAMLATAALAASDIYETAPTFSPYSAGVVRRSVLEEALREVNYVRALAGVPSDVRLDDGSTSRAQHGAVLMDANDVLSHAPTRPADMPQGFYELGYDGTSHGNIAASWTSRDGKKTGNITLGQSIAMWLADDDDRNIVHVGHRRWILDPRMRRTGFGISTRRGYSVMYVIEDRDDLTYEEWEASMKWPVDRSYVAWPVDGRHPRRYFGADVPWSVSLNGALFDECDDDAVTVRLTRKSDGRTWIFRADRKDGFFNVSHEAYAYDECIIFRPDGISEYGDGETWSVEITGLKEQGTGAPRSISYATTFTGASLNDRRPDDGSPDDGRRWIEEEAAGCNGSFGALALAALVTVALRPKKR